MKKNSFKFWRPPFISGCTVSYPTCAQLGTVATVAKIPVIIYIIFTQYLHRSKIRHCLTPYIRRKKDTPVLLKCLLMLKLLYKKVYVWGVVSCCRLPTCLLSLYCNSFLAELHQCYTGTGEFFFQMGLATSRVQ